MNTTITYTPQLIVDVENAALLDKLKNTIKKMQGVGKIVVAKKQTKATVFEETHSQASNLYEISPRLKALEGDFVCPQDMSFDYKKEIAKIRAERYL